jgi:hypothetical protein
VNQRLAKGWALYCGKGALARRAHAFNDSLLRTGRSFNDSIYRTGRSLDRSPSDGDEIPPSTMAS